MIGDILVLLLMGLVIGALARLLVPGRDRMSIGATMLLGIVGTLVGGLIGRAVFHDAEPGFFMGLVTAVILLFVLRRATRRGTV